MKRGGIVFPPLLLRFDGSVDNPQLRTHGRAVEDNTWIAGYRWSNLQCQNCNNDAGWSFVPGPNNGGRSEGYYLLNMRALRWS